MEFFYKSKTVVKTIVMTVSHKCQVTIRLSTSQKKDNERYLENVYFVPLHLKYGLIKFLCNTVYIITFYSYHPFCHTPYTVERSVDKTFRF